MTTYVKRCSLAYFANKTLMQLLQRARCEHKIATSFGQTGHVVVVTRPLPIEEWGHDGRPCPMQKPGNSPGPGPEVVTEEGAVQTVRSWTVQNEMKGVLGRVSAGTTRRILNSINLRKIRAQQYAVSVAAKTRERAQQA